MSIVSNIIYAITDIHRCFSSNIINGCATCFAQIEMFFYTVLQVDSLAGLPSYLQRSFYIPKHLGKHFSKPTKL